MAPSEIVSAVTRVTGKPPSLFLSVHSLSKHTKGHAKVKRRPTRDRNTEKSSNNATREKAEEPERVQVELKETERRGRGFKTRSHQRAARVAGPGIS
ncbi:hypothetical protein M9H77_05149 [Catharanthus roseus]|uniref:Uncharacterized protein n=1 Tax=Catharanthus roseus TaxID=4058 RepID=A0ACC0CGQ0_CATRO|nr:hypothetical protein M9H77_05149 [Catharanthus roseus]